MCLPFDKETYMTAALGRLLSYKRRNGGYGARGGTIDWALEARFIRIEK